MAKTVTHTEDGKALFGTEDHLQVAQAGSFARMIFELLSERAPSGEELRVFDLILNLSIDHGPDTPSAVKVVEAAKSGKTISESVAAGLLEINDTHGGAAEPLMEILYQVQSSKFKVQSLVEEYLTAGKRMPGFGHRIYKDTDPRAELILNEVKNLPAGPSFIEIAKQIETELEIQKSTKLPLNIDGAIAVALCSFGWDPKLGKAVFIIARTPGLCGQYLNAYAT